MTSRQLMVEIAVFFFAELLFAFHVRLSTLLESNLARKGKKKTELEARKLKKNCVQTQIQEEKKKNVTFSLS